MMKSIPPTMVGSFLSFFIIGIVAIVNAGKELNTFVGVRTIIVVSIVLCVISYYSLSIVTEKKWEIEDDRKFRISWLITAAQYFLLFSTWFILINYEKHFGILICLLYATYVLWDILNWKDISCTYRNQGGLWLFGSDCFGLIVYGLFSLMLMYCVPDSKILTHRDVDVYQGLCIGGSCVLVLVHFTISMLTTYKIFRHRSFNRAC
uniref:Uncharacterized protein n=1 Tax=Candidatus Kentrum sp. FW TaxID=2126338 RepID=A0A450SA11_9GAMM|nr:MAG: hypothetical protein BECKFW1821A_GA0114235_102113 [Candidatus Kentron sp. FW]